MRPARFQDLLVTAAASIPGVEARTFADAGHTAHPYGVITQLDGGGSVWWQIVATSAPGDSYDKPERDPITGDRPAPITAPTIKAGAKGVPLATAEQALAANILTADTAGEIAHIETYSSRDRQVVARYGLVVDGHDKSRVFVHALATLRQGESDPGRRLFKADDTV